MSAEEHKRQEGARTKATTAGQVASNQPVRIGGEWKFQKQPQFLDERLAIWNDLYTKHQEKVNAFPKQAIKITMPDGAVKEGTSFETSPYIIACGISKQFADKLIVAKVKYSSRVATLDEGLLNPEAEEGVDEDDQWFYWDLHRVLEGDCHLLLFKFEDKEGKDTFWHSSAHVLGQTLENEYGVHLCHGPPTDSGFFYDSYTGKDIFVEKNYKDIEAAAKKIVADKQDFSRLVLNKDQALTLFGSNPFKVQLIQSKIPEGGKVTAYRCGKLIDLCTGPHIPTTKIIKAFKIMKNSSAYWLGKAGNDSLQRIYGVSYPSKKEMDEYIALVEEAAKRDHRNIGRQQELFDFHPLTPGCAFMYPKGAMIYNKLMDMIREQYRFRGYQEVISPNIFNLKLWKTSGHYKNYKDAMFFMKEDVDTFGMKSMNCPGHCLMFANQLRTYRELPIRMADFGVLHRNELSGALTGLTRVRRFCQDDAHHFCAPHQIEEEVLTTLDFLEHIYGIFGFKFDLELSTRPEKRLGDEALWDKAEAALEAALVKFGKPWKINAGDGAFYGPKIDIKVYDALKRAHQCGTVQLDFQLPIRFNLQYKTDQKEAKEEEPKKLATQFFEKDEYAEEEFEWKEQPVKPGFARPVIVHRAVLGSVERFMAVLIEHTAGKWPFFLSPRQCMIVPISLKYSDYCQSVYLYLHKQGYNVEIDLGTQTLNKKVRQHQLAQYNYILIAGEQEATEGTIDIRSRDNQRIGKMRVDKAHEFFQSLLPKNSNKFEQFYEKAWDPAHFSVGTCADSHGAPAEKQKTKLYVKDNVNHLAHMIQVVGDLAGADVEVVVTSEKSKHPSGRFPYLETSNGSVIWEPCAIAKHLARMNPSAGLLGGSPFEQAKVIEWIDWAESNALQKVHEVILPVLGYGSPDPKKHSAAVAKAKEVAKTLNAALKGKKWFVGDKMTLADLYIGNLLTTLFQTTFDAGFRKAMPDLAKWFEQFTSNKAVIKRMGAIKACAKALKPGQTGGAPAAKAEKKEDEMDDLFGDDDGDADAAKKAAAAAKEKAKGKKEKKPVIAQSLVMFEVKPLESDTDLDALAKRIFDIKGDGIYWKTQYKKEPIAFGIFKLIIGVTVEDEKVSVDGLEEKITAFDDMVQSVDILAFNKI